MSAKIDKLKSVYNISGKLKVTSERKYAENFWIGVVAESAKEAIEKTERKYPDAEIHAVNQGNGIHIE